MEHCHGMAPAAQPFDLLALFVVGLTISLGHCVGMCGPLVTAFSVAQQRLPGRRSLLGRLLIYHGGRVAGYALLGAAMGLVGSTVFLAGEGRRIQGSLSLLVGALMLLLALGLLGWLPTQRWVEGGPLQRLVSGRLKSLLAADTAPRVLGLGFANGFLPCGPVFATAMTAAATASVWKGAAAMVAFGLGTVPILVALGLGTGRLGLRWRSFFNRLGAILLLLIAVQLVLRGMASWGWIDHLVLGQLVIGPWDLGRVVVY